jgi:hypothetical protein
MKDLQDLLTKTMNDDGVQSDASKEAKPSLTIIIGGYNSIQAHTSVQINAEKLPETIESITQGLKDISPETMEKIAEPLGRLADAIASLIYRNQA